MLRVHQHLHFLHLLSTAGSKQCRALILTASKDQIKTLSEIIHNFLKGIIPVEEADKYKLAPHKHTLRKLSLKTIIRRRQFIVKNSNLIGVFLKTILPKFET